MPTTTFKPITQKHMGTLRRSMHRELKRIEAKKIKLSQEMATLEAAEQQLLVKTIEHLRIDTEGPFRGVHIDDSGNVQALYCPCPECQAELNDVSVTEATEIMIQRGFIHPNMADHMRMHASEADKQRKDKYVH